MGQGCTINRVHFGYLKGAWVTFREAGDTLALSRRERLAQPVMVAAWLWGRALPEASMHVKSDVW